MRTEKFHIEDPVFQEFLYSLLYNTTIEARRIIPPRYLKFIKNEGKAKDFIRRVNPEEAKALLSYLGVRHFQVFVAENNVNFKDLKQILDKFKNKEAISALKDIVEHKLFITSDKEFITLLGLVSQTIHHKSYTMNLELSRTGYHLHGWAKRLEHHPSKDMLENANILAKTLLSGALKLENSDFLFSLRPMEVQILLYLYPLKHTYVPLNQLYTAFSGYLTKLKITGCLKNLLASQHIQRSAITKEKEYTISGVGVRVVNDYMQAVLHANNFR